MIGLNCRKVGWALFLVSLFSTLNASAASGTWTSLNDGSWTNSANWSGAVIADGAGNTANFATLDLSANTTVTLDAPRTVGSLSFADQTAPIFNWVLNTGSAGPLTLSGAAPTITVINGSATINASLAGTSGLAKAGSGLLVLSAANSYSGPTAVNVGTLDLATVTFSASSPLNISANAVVESIGTLNLSVNASSTALDINGNGLLKLVSSTNSGSFPDLYFGPDHVSNTDWGARLASSLDLGSTQRFIFGKTGHNGVGQYGLNGADCQFNGSISGSGGMTFIAQNNWTSTDAMEVPFALNASNSFIGPIEIQRGSVYLGNASALVQTNALTFNPAGGNNARFFLYGNNATISDLSSSGTGSALIANGNLKTGATLTLGAATLRVVQNNNTVFGGVITDVFPEYTGSGTGTTGPLNLLKNGPALLRLTGANSYSGTTTIAAGLIQVDGTLGAGGVTVQSGGTLAGSGTLNGPVIVQPGGTIAPGSSGLGTLTISNSLTLNGTTLVEVSKTGSFLANDHLAGITSLNYGGTLIVTNVTDIHSGALSAGDGFILFTAGNYAGSFSSMTLPTLAAGLVWDTSNLTINGSIVVIDPTSRPLITTQPQNTTVSAGSATNLSVVAAGTAPLSFQWRKGTSVLQGAVGTSYSIPSASTNDAGGYSVVVTNINGGITSSVAILTVTAPGTLTNGLVVYLNFDNNLTAQGGTTNNGSIYTGGALNGPKYKNGMIGSAVTFSNTSIPGQPSDWAISLGKLEWIYSNNFSVSLWERTTSTTDGAFMGNKDWTSGADVGWVISNLDPKNLNYNAVGGTRRDIDLNPPFSDGNWHLITITFNRTANQVISYVDGVSVNTSDISPSGSASFNAGFNTLVGSSGNGLYSGAGDIDDLGIWNRVLTPQEISGIYGAGLNGQPLTGAVPGSAPVITTQPGNISVSTGSTATFTVNAGGQGTLTYQWKLNGTNLIGQTNATLSIPSVTAADQGIYTVLVNNGSGAVLSLGAVLRVYALVVSGQWDFDRGDLRATVGADMEFTGDTEAVTTFPIMSIAGQPARVMGFAANSSTQGFYVRHGAQPNGGGHFVNQYTLIMDVMFPAQSTGHWRALFQSDPFNHPGNDAEFLVGDDSSVPSPGGIGAGSQFDGQLVGDTWYRIAFAVDLTAPPGQQLSKYINGVNVGSQSLDGGVDGRYALGPTILLFTSGSTNGAYTQAGLVNSIQFINGWMSAQAIAALGGPTADGLPPGNAALKITSISRNASLLTLNWTGQDGQFQLQRSTNGAAGSWLDISPPDTNRTLTVPIISTTSFYRVKEQIPDIMVGLLPGGEESLPTRQIIRAAGQQVQFSGRPVDLILSPDKKFIYIKNINNLLVVDSSSWLLVQNLSYPASGASMHGIAVNPAGSRVYVTGAANELYEWILSTNGMASFSRTISMPSGSYPCGVAISADGTAAYVCLSIANKLAVVNLSNGSITRQINTGIAPWDVVLSPDGNTAYVSDWGGRFPVAGDQTATSAGTPVVIDSRGVASSGRISIVNLATGTETAQVETGLHPSDLELSSEGNTLYVANANSDTVTVIDTASRTVKETILVRPDPTFPYGSASDGLSISADGKTLFVASAGNNAVAVVELPNAQHTNSMVQGFLPSGWYPGSVTTDSNYIYTVNVKGLGSRDGQPATTTWQVYAPLGTANRIPIPDLDALSKYTAQSFEDGRVPQIKQTQLVLRPGQAPVPVPARVGEPSVFQHVLYILKENKTYDQMFGDMPQGNGNPSLCIYPQFVSPNHHALAQQFVLLDNFYCNGVNSSDGHSWSTEANNTDHLEKSFGGFSRSYTFGDDPLTYSSTGFLWNNALQHGLTFRNYGEMDYASPVPSSTTWLQIYTDFTNGTKSIHYAQNIGVASLRQYSSTNVPGWNVGIPDVVRADGFIKELNAAQSNGVWASLHLLYLPNDHTGGPPTPRAQVADNDLSLGRVVEAISKSSFWSNTVIFVIEDDPQSGYDHVDGHRSLCLVISPYTKRGQVISTFYNQPGVLHTMERILGLPAMNQQDAMSPLMFDCFTNAPDFSPYTTIPNNISLAEGVTGAGPLKGKQRYYAKLVEKMDFSKPDAINDDIFNRYIWATIKGDAPYPAKFVGGHGKGLKRLGLVLEKSGADDDD